MLEKIVEEHGLLSPKVNKRGNIQLGRLVRKPIEIYLHENAAQGDFGQYCDEKVQLELLKRLEGLFVEENVCNIAMSLAEGVINYHEHSFDGYTPQDGRELKITVQTDGKTVYAIVQSNGKEWNPDTALIPLDDEKLKWEPGKKPGRGRGHRIMYECCEFLTYSPNGREMHMGWHPVTLLRNAA